MRVQVCKHCEKKFLTRSKTKQFCCQKCKEAYLMKRREERGQLCWRCEKACGGCSWSDELNPVKGWTAKPVVVKDSEGAIRSYNIKKCPEFVYG